MDTTSNDKSATAVKVPTFSGKKSDYPIWWMRFRSHARVYNFIQALSEQPDPDLPGTEDAVIDESTDSGKKQKKALHRNTMAVSCLSMALQADDDLKLVMKSITADWPGGQAHIIIKGLNRNYTSENIAAKTRIRQDINKINMTDTMNPKILRKKISQIENRHNHELGDDDLVAIVIEKAAPVYNTIVAAEQRAKGSQVTADDLIDAMMTQWNLHHDEDDDGEDGTESSLDSGGLSLQATQVVKNAPICQAVGSTNSEVSSPYVICNFCQEPGHGYYQCPLRLNQAHQGTALVAGQYQAPNNGPPQHQAYRPNTPGQYQQRPYDPNRPRPYCEDCKVYGHSTHRCWENPKNAHLRPPNWTSRRQQQQAPQEPPPQQTPIPNGTQDIATVVASNLTGPPVNTNSATTANPSQGTHVEALLSGIEFPSDIQILRDPNIWIADTGATQHMTSHAQGMINLHKPVDPIGLVMANDTTETASLIGDLPGIRCDKHGHEVGPARLTGVNLLPSAAFNLFSVSKMLKQGWSLSGSSEKIVISKGQMHVEFDIVIPTPDGMIFCMYLRRDTSKTHQEIIGAVPNVNFPTKRNIMTQQQAHDRLGHIGNHQLKAIMDHLGFTLDSSPMDQCAACAAGKARRKNFPRSKSKTKLDDDYDPSQNLAVNRVYLDMSSVRRTPSMPYPKKYQWCMIVHGKTQLKFSSFHSSKNAMVEPVCELFQRWASNGLGVTHVRLDNAGENILLQSRAQSAAWKLGIEFEFTARNTPQQNFLAEVSISTIAMRGRAMMHRANLPLEYRNLLWTTAFDTATLLDGLVVIEINGVSQTRYEHWCGQLPKFAHHLCTWGEAGTVKIATDTSKKLNDRGAHCLFVGYCKDHAGDVYRMFNPTTKMVHMTRDVVWLRRMYFVPPPSVPHLMVSPVVDPSTYADHEDLPLIDDNAPFIEMLEDNNAQPKTDEIEPESNAPMEIERPTVETINQADDADDNVSVMTSATPRREQVTRTGRHVRPPKRLIEEYACAGIDFSRLQLSSAEVRYYQAMSSLGHEDADFDFAPPASDVRQGYQHADVYRAPVFHDDAPLISNDISDAFLSTDVDPDYQAPTFPIDSIASGYSTNSTTLAQECALVGAGLGGGIQNTKELHVLTYEEAINGPERDQWLESIENEYQRMIDNGVFIPCAPEDVPVGAKILSNVWAMKKKANGTFRARLNARGYEQVDGEHYDSHATFAPVASEMTIMIILVLIIIANWVVHIMDVKGAFLLGDFEKDRKMWMTIPKGMESKYPPGWLVFLGKTLYGTKQAARAFWNKVQVVMQLIGFLRNRADPCLYFAWTAFGLVIWLS